MVEIRKENKEIESKENGQRKIYCERVNGSYLDLMRQEYEELSKKSNILNRKKSARAFEELHRIQNGLYNLREQFEDATAIYEVDGLSEKELKGVILSEKIAKKAEIVEKLVKANLENAIYEYLRLIEEYEGYSYDDEVDDDDVAYDYEEDYEDENKVSEDDYGYDSNDYEDELKDESYEDEYDDDDEEDSLIEDDSLAEAIKVFREIYSKLEKGLEENGIGLIGLDRVTMD